MENENIISLQKVCTLYNIEVTFVHSLRDYGLIELVENEDEDFIHQDLLPEIERMTHLHYDLNINIEGIDAISHLLRRVEELQQELTVLRNKLQS